MLQKEFIDYGVRSRAVELPVLVTLLVRRIHYSVIIGIVADSLKRIKRR